MTNDITRNHAEKEISKRSTQDIDTTVLELREKCFNARGNLGSLKDIVKNMTTLASLFLDDRFANWSNSDFNGITQWDVSNVTDMNSTFSRCINFNQPIGSWNTSSLKDASYMFSGCEYFNQSLNNWNVSNLTYAKAMFSDCIRYNQPMDKWNTKSVKTLEQMFFKCTNFNQNINNWNTSNVRDMCSLFAHCINYNQPMDKWDVSKVVSMADLFANCKNFNQPLNMWYTASLKDIVAIFYGCEKFNQPLNKWNVSRVTMAIQAFNGASSFEQDLSGWDVGKLVYFQDMFENCPILPEHKPNFRFIHDIYVEVLTGYKFLLDLNKYGLPDTSIIPYITIEKGNNEYVKVNPLGSGKFEIISSRSGKYDLNLVYNTKEAKLTLKSKDCFLHFNKFLYHTYDLRSVRFGASFDDFVAITTKNVDGKYYFIKSFSDLSNMAETIKVDNIRFSASRLSLQSYYNQIYIYGDDVQKKVVDGITNSTSYILLFEVLDVDDNYYPLHRHVAYYGKNVGTGSGSDLSYIKDFYQSYVYLPYSSSKYVLKDLAFKSSRNVEINIYKVPLPISNIELGTVDDIEKIYRDANANRIWKTVLTDSNCNNNFGFYMFNRDYRYGICNSSNSKVDNIKIQLSDDTECDCIIMSKEAYTTSDRNILGLMETNDIKLYDDYTTKINNEASTRASEDTKLKNDYISRINNEAGIRESEDSYILSELRNSLPIGSIIQVWKSNRTVNTGLTGYYLRCDGSRVPDGSAYYSLKRVLTGYENNSFQNSVYLPDLTDIDVFLGGGTPGNYYNWTIPEIKGSSGTDGTDLGCFGNGIFKAWMGGGTWGNHKPGNGYYHFDIDLERLPSYIGHTNTYGSFYPNHYSVEYWIKYR